MIKNLLVAFMMIVGMAAVVVPQNAIAFDPFGSKVCSNDRTKQSAACNASDENPVSGTGGLLLNITDIVSFAAGAAAIIVLVYGSIKYITSAGDSAKVKSARDTVLYALIGIAIIVLARTLILYLLNNYG